VLIGLDAGTSNVKTWGEERAQAGFVGLEPGRTRAHLLRAVYEGAAPAARDCYEHAPVAVDRYDHWYGVYTAARDDLSDAWALRSSALQAFEN
jgi:sugar (pentulose or hexulose) kinase